MPNQMKREEMRAASDRPRVGPADAATIREKLAEYDASAKREAKAGLYQGQQPPLPRNPGPSDASGVGGRQRRAAIDRIVDEGK